MLLSASLSSSLKNEHSSELWSVSMFDVHFRQIPCKSKILNYAFHQLKFKLPSDYKLVQNNKIHHMLEELPMKSHLMFQTRHVFSLDIKLIHMHSSKWLSNPIILLFVWSVSLLTTSLATSADKQQKNQRTSSPDSFECFRRGQLVHVTCQTPELGPSSNLEN